MTGDQHDSDLSDAQLIGAQGARQTVLPDSPCVTQRRGPGDESTLTVRVERDIAVASKDDGRTWVVERDAVLAAAQRSAEVPVAASMSAAALASVAEARHAAPRPGQPLDRYRGPLVGTDTVRLTRRLGRLPFDELIDQRRSARTYAACTADEVLAVVAAVLHTRGAGVGDDGWLLRQRATPSAGGRHAIEVLVQGTSLAGLRDGLWHIDGDRALATRLDLDDNEHEHEAAALRAAGLEVAPPALLVLVADFGATTSRYPAGASLVWRDAGALATVLHLALSSVGLASRILGVGGPASPVLLTSLGWAASTSEVALVGALAVGGLESSTF